MIKVVYLEDCVIIRESIAELLRHQRFAVVPTARPDEALHAIKIHKPGLLLLELKLASGWCFDFLEQLAAAPPYEGLHVMALSEIATRDAVQRAQRLGVQGYLLKNRFTITALLSMIRLTLARPDISESTADAFSVPDDEGDGGSLGETADAESSADAKPRRIEINSTGEQSLDEMRPIVTKTRMKEELEHIQEIKAMSPTVAMVLDLTKNDNANVDSIVKAVRSDHAIALKLIRLANSSVYARGESVNSLKDAILRIGITELRQAVLNIGVMDSFSDEMFGGTLSIAHFWEHSISTGLIASMLAREHCDLDPDAAFAAGLIHDIGKLLLAGRLPEEYANVLSLGAKLGIPTERIESRLLGLNHAEIMDRVLRAWNFPPDLIDPIVFHELSIGNIRRASAKRMRDVAVLGLANRLAHAMLLGSSGNDVIASTIEHCEALQIPAALLARIVEDVPAETDDIRLSMMTKTPDAQWGPYVSTVLDQFDAPVRLVCHSIKPACDAVQLFCDRLSAPMSIENAPSIGVVHIADQRDIGELSEMVKNRTADGILDPDSPLIMLSPTGKLELKPHALDQRTTVLQKISFTVNSFLAMVNSLVAVDE